jgi:hypothetical protein
MILRDKMKLEEFTATPYGNGKVQIYFTEPVLETDYEMTLFLKHFNKRKNVRFFYTLKPVVSIEGLICSGKVWSTFLTNVRRQDLAKGFYELMRDVPFGSVEGLRKYLSILRDAEIKAADANRKTTAA